MSPGFQCPQSSTWWGGVQHRYENYFFFFLFFKTPPPQKKKPFPLTVFAVPSKTWNLSWGCVFMLNKDPFPNETLRILQRGLRWSLTDSTSLDERRDNQKDAALLRCQLPTPTSWCVGLVKGRFCSRGNRSKNLSGHAMFLFFGPAICLLSKRCNVASHFGSVVLYFDLFYQVKTNFKWPQVVIILWWRWRGLCGPVTRDSSTLVRTVGPHSSVKGAQNVMWNIFTGVCFCFVYSK